MTKALFLKKMKNFFIEFYESFFSGKNLFLKIMTAILSPIFLLTFSIGKSLEVAADNGTLLPFMTILMSLVVLAVYSTLIYAVFLILLSIF